MQMHNKEVLDMRSQADLLYNEQNCYSEQNSVEENCTFDQYTALRDSCFAVKEITLYRFVNMDIFVIYSVSEETAISSSTASL